MKTFKKATDVARFLNHPHHATIESLFLSIIADCPDYRPENDGWLVLIELADVDRVLDDLVVPYRLSEVPFEGVTVVDGCLYAVYLANNQFALGFLIPDEAWLPGEVRRVLVDYLDPRSFAPDVPNRMHTRFRHPPAHQQELGRGLLQR